MLRSEPGVYGPVASDPTVSRLIGVLAADVAAVVKAINTARAAARARVWALAGDRAPDHARSATDPLIVDVDATLVTSHSDKQHAAPTFKRGRKMSTYLGQLLIAFVEFGSSGGWLIQAAVGRGSGTGWWRTNRCGWAA